MNIRERLKMENVLVECVDPWKDERAKAVF